MNLNALSSQLITITYPPVERVVCGVKVFLLTNALLFPLFVLMDYLKPGSASYLLTSVFLGGSALASAFAAAYTTLLIERGVIRSCFAIKNGAAHTYVDLRDRMLVVGRTDIRFKRAAMFEESYQELLRVPLDRAAEWQQVLADHNLFLNPDGRPPRPLFGVGPDGQRDAP